MTNIMSLGIKNGGITQYGQLQSEIVPMPSSASTKVLTPDGSSKPREERLKNLPDVPVDDRGAEVTSALIASTIVGFCVAANILGLEDVSPYTNLILGSILTVGLVDNFYGVIQGALSLVKDKINVELPSKEKLPLGLGTGAATGTVVRGLSRLLSVDTERECQSEAAAFFAAYSLGLPCFAFRPNALEVCFPSL